MHHTNHQLIPVTPAGAVFGNGGPAFEMPGQNNFDGSVSKVLQTAKKDRDRATAALQSVKKALREAPPTHDATTPGPQGINNLTTPYTRISPGHFLLSSRAHTGALGPPPSTISRLAGTPTNRAAGQSPGSVALVENLAAALLPHATTPHSGSRLGRLETPGPAQRTIPEPHYAMTPAGAGILKDGNSGGTGSMSKRLTELQQYHSRLLTECQEAENAAAKAKEEKKIAQTEVKKATRKLQELEAAIKACNDKLAAQHAQQETAMENANMVEVTKEQLEKSSEELARVQAQLEDAKTTLAEVTTRKEEEQARLKEAEEHLSFLEDTQTKLSEARVELENTLRRRAIAEQQTAEAENRCATVTTTLSELEARVATRLENATTADALIAEAEIIVEDREARASQAQQQWQEAEEKLAVLDSALVEATGRLKAKRDLLAEVEERYEVLRREMRRAEAETEATTAAAEAASHELAALQSRVKAAREAECVALARVEEAETRASVACQMAAAEEARAEAAGLALQEIESRCAGADQAERRLLELRAEIGEGEAVASLKEQVNVLMQENSVLQEELKKAKEVGVIAAAEAQHAQQAERNTASRLQAALTEAESMALMQEIEIEAARQAEGAALAAQESAENRATTAEGALSEALNEIDRLTHSHTSIAELNRLETELTEVRAQLNRACKAAMLSASRAEAAERQMTAADTQITQAIEERESALKHAEAARDAAVAQIAELKKEAAHRDTTHAELSVHVAQLTSVVRSLKQERRKAEALAMTLQLQVESLQGQLRLETGRKMALAAITGGSSSRGTNNNSTTNTINTNKKGTQHEDLELKQQVERLTAQNGTLKATATRLSRALSSALQQKKGSDGNGDGSDREWGLIPAMRELKMHGAAAGSGSAQESSELKAVLEQLEAVEEILSNASIDK